MKRRFILMVLLGWICIVNGADSVAFDVGNSIKRDRKSLAEEDVEKHPTVVSVTLAPENIQNSEDAQEVNLDGESFQTIESLRMENARLRNLLREAKASRKTETDRMKDEINRLKSELFRRNGTGSGSEAEILRKELIETLVRSSENLEKLKILEFSAASVLDTLDPVYMTSREVELAETLGLLITAGNDLAGKSAMVAERALKILPEAKLDSIEQAKMRVALEELLKAAGRFAKLSLPPGDPEGFESCRVLAVDKSLGVAVLSAGYRNGVRVNLKLWADNGSQTGLKVVALRSFVCAAMIEEGSLEDIVPGMKINASKTLKKK